MANIPSNALKVDLPYSGARKFSLQEWHQINLIIKEQKVELKEAIELFATNPVVKK